MVLEQYSENKIDNEAKLKQEIDWALKELRGHENQLAGNSIKNLNENQLATFIENSFKNKESGAWDEYKTMKNNPYFAFMVQSSLDLLSDIFGDKKYNKDGKEAPANSNSKDYKSLDEWLTVGWWIDNTLDTKSNTAIRIVQKILWINVDWAAGPQFFAKVCSILRWEDEVDANHFRVNWHEHYAYNINSSNSRNNNENIVDNSEHAELSKNEEYVMEHFPVKEMKNVDKAYYWIPRNRKVFKYNNSDEYCYVDWDIVKRFPVFAEGNNNIGFLPRVESASIAELKNSHVSQWKFEYPNKCKHFQEQYERLLKNSFNGFQSTEWKSIEYENWFYYIKSYNQKFKIDYYRNSDVWWSKWQDYIWINFRLWDLCNKLKSEWLTWWEFLYVDIGNVTRWKENDHLLAYWGTNPKDIVSREDSIKRFWWFNKENVDIVKFKNYLNHNL